MEKSGHLSLIGICLLLALILGDIKCGLPLAVPRQLPLHVIRQKKGLVVHSPSGRELDSLVNLNATGLTYETTKAEKKLASQLEQARNRKGKPNPQEWRKLYAKYAGYCPQVLTAAMQAALRHRDYEEGYDKVYKRVRYMTLPTYSVAIQLLGKLGKQDEVERLWQELLELNLVNQVLAESRMDAAADNGDIQGATQVLDYMRKKNITANVVHYSTAIKACANAHVADRAKKAQAFFDEMLARGVKRNVVTYSCLLRALQDEPSQSLLDLLADMERDNIIVDKVFMESFVLTFLNIRKGDGDWRKAEVVATHLKNQDVAHLKSAKDLIAQWSYTVSPSRFCMTIDRELGLILIDEAI